MKKGGGKKLVRNRGLEMERRQKKIGHTDKREGIICRDRRNTVAL